MGETKILKEWKTKDGRFAVQQIDTNGGLPRYIVVGPDRANEEGMELKDLAQVSYIIQQVLNK